MAQNRLVAALLALFTGLATARAQDRQSSLFSEDRKDVMQYLEHHHVPEIGHVHVDAANPSGTAYDIAIARDRQIKRALELFLAGDTELRLRIAMSMEHYSDKGPSFWDACGPDDYEARHYLVMGLAMDQGRRTEARSWVLDEAHPSLAEPLLRAICRTPILSDSLEEDQKRQVLGLLGSLYRQSGNVTLVRPDPGAPAHHGDSGPLSRYVVRGLARLGSEDALDQLVEWMAADGKKVENSVRVEMWSALGRFALRYSGSRRLQDAQFVRSLAQRSEIAELFALTKRPRLLPPTADDRSREGMALVSGELRNDPEHARLFKRALAAELANPDADVVRGVVRCVMSRADDAELLGFVRALELSAHARQKACEAIERTTPDDLGVENMPNRTLAVRKRALSRALGEEP
jgi:hypothetical protein